MSEQAEASGVRVKGDYLLEALAPGLLEWTHARTGAKRWTHVQQVAGVRRERALRVRNRSEAKTEAQRLRGLATTGEMVITPSGMKVNDLYDLWAAHWASMVADGSRSPGTWELLEQRWKKYVEPLVGSVKLADLSKQHVGKVLQKAKADGKSPSLQDSLLDLLSGLCGYAIDNDLLRINPARLLPKSQRPQVRSQKEVYTPSEAETERLHKAMTQGWKTYFLLLAETGLRTSEALGLTWADIDFEANTIRVEYQLAKGTTSTRVPLKTKRSRRSVHLTAKLRKALLAAKMKTKFKADGDLVFTTTTGKSVGSYNARRAFLSALSRAKIDTKGKRLSPHSLRHAYGTRLLVAGLPVEAVSRLLGHASPVVTLSVYSHTLEHLTTSGELATRVEAALGGAAL